MGEGLGDGHCLELQEGTVQFFHADSGPDAYFSSSLFWITGTGWRLATVVCMYTW